MSTEMRCQWCAAVITDVRFSFQEVHYPYNPEWPLELVRAGQACSAGCLSELVLTVSAVEVPNEQ